ncbi:hypothetical protein WN51_14323 [Melipona quadrifasciata]|uniref:Uncharacterized protein n=1 Tax=Melipona quadrifasciata TaxID=166423 RepID=A0A0N0BGI5_9HYME|nr:hypothetical protein WN51_14323 [Melipona quadrifasciata]
MLLQIVSGGTSWCKGGPHHTAILHSVSCTGIENSLILNPPVLRLYTRSRIWYGNHAALTTSVAAE